MFVVNAIYGINAGTWALIITTVIAIVAMLYVFRRPPIFPLIASTVTVVFGGLTIITHDPMWVQIKVTIFNALFGVFLFGGLWLKHNFFKYVFEKTFHYTEEGWNKFTWSFACSSSSRHSPTSPCAWLQGRARLRHLWFADERREHLDRV